jgi:DNA-binding MarR family transcriptional regulator
MPKRTSRLQEEIHQSRPFASPRIEATAGLMRTAAVVRRALGRAVERLEISLPQYNVLRILRGAGAEGLPTLCIRDRMIEEAAGITRLVDKLAASGFLERTRTPSDRRQVVCRITPKGLSLLTRVDPVIDQAVENSLLMLSHGQVDQLRELLDVIRAGHERGDAADTDVRGRGSRQRVAVG